MGIQKKGRVLKGSSLVGPTFLTFLALLPQCMSYHCSLCIGTPDYIESEPTKFIYWFKTIGTGANDTFGGDGAAIGRLMNPRTTYEDGSTTVNYYNETVNPMVAHPIKYQSMDIEDNDNQLFGWLHMDVKVTATDDASKALKDWKWLIIVPSVILGPDATFAAGKIVATKFSAGSECKERLELTNPSEKIFPRENLAPCRYAQDPIHFVPQGFAYYNANRSIRAMKFNFRMNFPTCGYMDENQKLEFRILPYNGVSYPTDKFEGVAQHFISFSRYAYGGHDPEPPRNAPATCGSELITQNTSANSWIHRYDEHIKKQVDYWDKCGACTLLGFSSFEGRCSLLLVNKQYDCRDYVSEVQQNYSIYTNDGCDNSCGIVRNTIRKQGVSASSEIGLIIWGLRSTHGMVMVIATMFVFPVSIFLSRYYKETWMNGRYINIHIWHGIHIYGSLAGFSLLTSGIVAGNVARAGYFGISMHPVSWIHVVCGYISFALVLLAFLINGIRIFQVPIRIVFISVHFASGCAPRILWALCLLTSVYIPASPSALSDVHVNGFRFEPYLLIVLVWIIFDVVVQGLMINAMCKDDKILKFERKRIYALAVPIPLLRPHVEEDVPGHRCRKLWMIAYGVVSLVLSVLLVVVICLNNPFGRFFGKMWSTHKKSGKLNVNMTDLWSD